MRRESNLDKTQGTTRSSPTTKLISSTHSVHGGCSTCKHNDVYKNLTIIEIKKIILKKLNMPNGPPMPIKHKIDRNTINRIISLNNYNRKDVSYLRHSQFNLVETEESFRTIFAELRE